MTKEEKTLLTKVLCEQLPYGVKVAIDFQSYIAWLPDDKNLAYPYRKNLNFILDYDKKTIEDISKEPNIVYSYPCAERFQMLRGYTYQEDYGVPVEFIKPYFRPLSSITEDEMEELKKLQSGLVWRKDVLRDIVLDIWYNTDAIDYLNAKHFDVRGVLPNGLGVAAVGKNNPYNEEGGTK